MDKIQAQLDQLLVLQKDILTEQELMRLQQMDMSEQIEYLERNTEEIKRNIDRIREIIDKNEKYKYEVI